jgi:small subunit ribosomal protein S4
VMGKQFQRFYRDAARRKGITGENLLALLELRLDNVVYRARWGSSRAQARQLVRHGHILVDGKRVDIPSYRVRSGQVISLNPKARDFDIIAFNREHLTREIPAWLEPTEGGVAIRVLAVPLREQIDTEVREQLIVELFSK